MPFIEVSQPKNAKLNNEISIDRFGTVRVAYNISEHFPSHTVKIFIDEENKLLGLQDSGPIPIKPDPINKNSMRIQTRKLRDYRIKYGRYKVSWNEKHQMIIAEIEFDK